MGRRLHFLGASIAGLLVLAGLALAVGPDGAGSTRLAASGPQARGDGSAALPEVDEPTEGATTTVPSETTVPTTVATEPVVTTRVPVTEAPTATTSKPTTTVATGPAPTSPPTTVGRTVTVTPGQGAGAYTVSGTGCTGADAGAGMYFYDPDGQMVNGDGGAAMPDGTWAVPVYMPQGAGPGPFTVKAFCTNATTNVKYFDYPPVTFSVS